MKKHDESRRAFLIGATMGAAATTTLVPDAIAQTHEQHGAVAPPAEAAAHGHGAGHGVFFNDDDAATLLGVNKSEWRVNFASRVTLLTACGAAC
jgi:hypothetical protein